MRDTVDSPVHGLILSRLYHEDILLTQRTYNFLTFNVFLSAVLILSGSASGTNVPVAGWYLICMLGVVVSCLQVAFGRRMDVSIAFWREYLKLIELDIHLPVDHMLFEFYRKGEVRTPWGLIGSKRKKHRAMFKTFPWSLMPSTNLMIGVFLPWLVAALWLGAVAAPLYRAHHFLLLAVPLLAFLALSTFAWIWPVPTPPRIIKSGDGPPNEPLQPTAEERGG